MTHHRKAHPRSAPSRAPHPWVLAVLLMLVVAAAVWVVDREVGEVVAILGMVLGHGTAGVVTLRKARAFEGRERTAWQLIGAGFSSVAVGVLIVAVWDSMASAPAFGFFDVFFLAAYVMVLSGFAWLPHLAGDWAHRTRLLLDGLIGGISIGAVLWLTLVSRLLDPSPAADTFERLVGTAYPLLDLMTIVVVMIVVVRRSAYRFDPRMLLLALGMSVQAVADITFLETALGKQFSDAVPFYPLFLASAACFLGVGILLDRRPPPREYADRRTALFWMLAPYSAATILIGLLVAEVASSQVGARGRLLFFVTLVVGGLVVARQAVAIRENLAIVERQRTALVSSISHELRTPLTAMVGFLEVLDDDSADRIPSAERREMLHLVREQSTYLTRIVTDLVMLARGDIDRMQLQPRVVDVTSLILSSVATVEGASDDLIVDAPRDLFAEVDPDRIRQVLVNLISNASRYGGDRRLVVARREGDLLVLEVHDDGPGVPKKYELVIWERFERGPNRLNATVPGSGIGLAVVDAIARVHGGTVSYRRSERLGGACFSVLIPGAVRPGLMEDSTGPSPEYAGDRP